MKWRGATLSDFDGKRWTNPGRKPEMILGGERARGAGAVGVAAPRGGASITASIWKPWRTRPCSSAGTPETLDLRARALYRYEASSFRLGHATPPGFHYDAVQPSGRPSGKLARALSASRASVGLSRALPAIAHPRPPHRGNWRAPLPPVPADLARARSIERHLRSDYAYTLQLPDREMADPLANFLFARRKGHCEYFASSMAVMLRSLGIPARLATGFQSGVHNPVSDLWLIRASDAHSWVEAWIPGYGWKTFDPTRPTRTQADWAC